MRPGPERPPYLYNGRAAGPLDAGPDETTRGRHLLDWSLDPSAVPYVIPLLATALIAAFLAAYAFARRPAAGAVVFSIQMWGLAVWTCLYLLELASRSFEAKIFWNKLEYPATFVALLAWLGVALQYSGHEAWVTRRNILLAGIVPSITTLLVFTNEFHHFIWARIWRDTLTPSLVVTHGGWFWVHIAYCYLLLSFCSVLIVQRVVRAPERRRQGIPLLISVLAPWTGNALHLAGLTPGAIDPTPFAFTVSGIALAYGLIHLRLLDIVPLARARVIEAMPDGMMVLDVSGRVVDLNPAARRMLGLSPSMDLGLPANEALQRWPEIVERYRHVLEGQAEITVGEGEARRDYDLRIAPLVDRHGEPAGRVAVWRDVTAGKRAREALADEHTTLQALIQSSRDGIVLLGNGPVFRVVNAPALRLLHLPGEPQDWLGRPLQEALTILSSTAPQVGEALRNEMRRVQTGDLGPGENEYEAPPHIVRWVNLPVRGSGSLLGRLLVLRDVTEDRALDRARDELTHTMVHDLRNPLTSIRGALEVLDLTPHSTLTGADWSMVKVAREGTERLLGLVRAILDVSQLEGGRMPLDRQIVPLRPLVTETFHFQAPLAQEKGVRLQNNVGADQPHLWVDPGLLRRVLQNLVENAIKFTPSGGLVSVEVAAEPESTSSLRILVSDTGPGIPPSLRGQLFQKFVRGRQKGYGSGLGLAFCRLAVEAHGGRIWLDGDVGGGATVVFTLPVAP
jgi:PAS domain S-box-containing protein